MRFNSYNEGRSERKRREEKRREEYGEGKKELKARESDKNYGCCKTRCRDLIP